MRIFSNSFLAAARNNLLGTVNCLFEYFLCSTMSYTSNQTNSSSVSGSSVVFTPTPGATNSDTVDALMIGMSNVDDTQLDSDDDDIDDGIDWGNNETPVVKYCENIPQGFKEQQELTNALENLLSKMDSVTKHVKLIIQREALLAQASAKASRKRKRKKQSTTKDQE